MWKDRSERKGWLAGKPYSGWELNSSLVLITIGIIGTGTDGLASRLTKNKMTFRAAKQKLKVNHGLSH
jgi:hypothetical protein